ncbi:zinc-dependent metalloprotease [Trichocoleus desertorum AS-A10]|uniref:zinc-dependent metalloprotease n=1 Tax=Trichocoleus desertorum TaxID=1481672 RepID=UPI00329769A6
MKKFSFYIAFLCGLFLFVGVGLVQAYEPNVSTHAAIAPNSTLVTSDPATIHPLVEPTIDQALDQAVGNAESLVNSKPFAIAASDDSSEDADEASDLPDLQPFDKVIKKTQKISGLFTLYRNKETGKLYAEIKPGQLNQNFLATMTLESGIGESGLYSGLPTGDFLFQFRRVNQNIHFVVPNTYFRTRAGDPLQRSLDRSFSDSVLASLPIKSIHPKRKTVLVDLGPLLLNDFASLSPVVSWMLESPYSIDSNKSYFGPAKAFPFNVEIESVYGFSGGGGESAPSYINALPDSRALTLRVHYSFSELPKNNPYRPRIADDRVGYFITAYQDFSDDNRREPFVRYINRWDLQKQDPDAALSPPKQPIVFWIENTVPLEYREAVQEGVLMWNRAFEKIGFLNAIEVKQMPDNATWDPADIRYNTIRWFNSFDSAFAMGPSRVNPLTGEILDADIIVDGNFIRYLKQGFQALVSQSQPSGQPSSQPSGPATAKNLCALGGVQPRYLRAMQSDSAIAQPAIPPAVARIVQQTHEQDACYGMELAHQFAAGHLSLSLLQNAMPSGAEMQKYIHQFMRELIAHEVGHTLGLRHNFHGSTMVPPQDLNNTKLTQSQGLVASVMDYNAANLAPQGGKQGDYFTEVIGPYDEWAIEYGYKPIVATVPQAEIRGLQAIAQRAPQAHLAYATDEDVIAGLDPEVNAFDLSGDVLLYSQWQMDNAREMWKRLDKRYPVAGESYSEVRDVFDTIFFYYLGYALNANNFIGGQSLSRYHGGDAAGRLPLESIPVEKQRQALALVQKYVFNEESFQFSPRLLNKLAPSRWNHWGTNVPVFNLDYPIHDRVLFLQSIVLRDLLSADRLSRLQDTELKTEPGKALTLPELFDTLQTSIWQGVVRPSDQPMKFSSLNRALQREHLNLLTAMVLRKREAPEDARTLAWYELRQLHGSLSDTLRKQGRKLDTYTKAHLEETRDRIAKTLEAQLQTN